MVSSISEQIYNSIRTHTGDDAQRKALLHHYLLAYEEGVTNYVFMKLQEIATEEAHRSPDKEFWKRLRHWLNLQEAVLKSDLQEETS